jgi:hypothetical protein
MALPVGEILADFPVALLVTSPSPAGIEEMASR